MQDIIAYVCAAETLGSFRDVYGVKEVAAPTLIRGGEYCLRLRLFAESGRNDPVPLSQFDSVESFVFAMDSDWDESTTCKIIADNDNISVSSVTVPATDDREQLICTEIAIPLPATNTQEVIDFIGNRESGTGLTAELAGYSTDGKLSYLLQLKNFTIRNRLTSAGEPTELPETVADRAWVLALLRAGFEVDFRETSDGGTEFRLRSASAGGEWSEWILLPRGQEGAQGQNGTGLQIDQFGLFSERPASPDSYPFCYFATDTNLAYFWDGSAWSDGVTITGPAGPPGENGTDGADGETIIADPAVEFTILNETYGRCVQLDATTPTMNFANSVWEISTIRFRAVSANPDVTGNAVLIAIVDGVEREPVTVAVGATPGTIEIPLDPAATGQFAIKRDVSSDSDTLQDGEPVSLLLLNAEVKK